MSLCANRDQRTAAKSISIRLPRRRPRAGLEVFQSRVDGLRQQAARQKRIVKTIAVYDDFATLTTHMKSMISGHSRPMVRRSFSKSITSTRT
jgi:hypothetical protein